MTPSKTAILAGILTGPTLGAIAWLLLGGAPAAGEQLQLIQERLSAARLSQGAEGPVASFNDAAARPLFALTTGPNAIPETQIRLDGIALEPHRIAALLSINGAPAAWLERGKSLEGVSLVAVLGSTVQVETETGPREIALASASAPSPSPGPSAPMPSPRIRTDIPPGVRLPPPPATAPKGP